MKLSLFLLVSLAALAYCTDTVIEKRETPVVSQIDAEISQIDWEKRDRINKRYWGGYGGNNYNNNNGNLIKIKSKIFHIHRNILSKHQFNLCFRR